MKGIVWSMILRALRAIAAGVVSHYLAKHGIALPIGGEAVATSTNTGLLMGLEKGIRAAWPALKARIFGK